MDLHELNRILIRRGGRNNKSARRFFNLLKPAGFAGILLLSILISGGIIASAGFYAWVTADLPAVQETAAFFDPQNGLILQPSRMYDRTGEHELLSLDNPGSLRAYVWLDPARDVHFSPLLVQAVTALVQPDFWQSSGADWQRWSDSHPHTIAEGIVDRLLLWRDEPSLGKSLRMRLLAWQITNHFGREKVLEWYLNSAPFGRQVTGAESAARVYFGKSSAEINEAEAALLAGLAIAPALNPHDSPQAAEDLMKETLDRLEIAGVYSPDTKRSALASGLTIAPPVQQSKSISPAFTSLVLRQLTALVSDDRVALGGLQIRTTLDLNQQEQLDCTLRIQLEHLENIVAEPAENCAGARLLPSLPPIDNSLPAGVKAAGILIDPARSEVLAIAGRTDVNQITDDYGGMQGGTILNPFLAAAAFSRGYSPASLVWDLPDSSDSDVPLLKEIATKYRGPIRLRTALVSDRLNPLETMLNQLGARNAWRLVRPLGLENLDNAPEPEKLLEGGVSVSLLEVAQGMTVFANLGDLYGLPINPGGSLQPSTLLAVEDSFGQTMIESTLIRKQSVLSSSLAFLVHDVLTDEPLRRAELGYPNPFELGRPAGAKFGSAEKGREIWAAGYTTQRVAVIWMGLPVENGDFVGNLGVRAVGGIWNAVMRYSLADEPATDWNLPPGVSKMEVCDPSGLLPTRVCPSRVSEVFLQGNEPAAADDLYRTVQINRETGRIATVFTPPGMLEEQVFLTVPEFARNWARAAGLSLAPTDYDTIQAGSFSDTVKIDQPALFTLVNGKVVIQGTAAGEGFHDYRLQVGEGLNPRQWLEITSSTIPVESGELGEWDTSDKNGLFAIRLLVVRDNNQVETALSQVTVDNQPPKVTILSPLANYPVSGAKPVFMQVEASDASGITRVEWMLDGETIGESPRFPFTNEWQNPTRGKHELKAAAIDTVGNQAISSPVTFVVE